jgi:hypothetical protein
MAASSGSEIAAALQGYATRGVFRGFSSRARAGGREEFAFTWLTRKPMRLSYDAESSRLRFIDLWPQVGSYPGLAADLKRVVQEHQSAAVPEHRRIDGRRVRLASALRRGSFSLVLTVRGAHQAYAVQRSLNLVNQLFLLLQENYPEYLIECFGFSAE